MVLTMTSIDGWDPDAWGMWQRCHINSKVVYLISAIILSTPNYHLWHPTTVCACLMGAYSTVIAPLPPTASNYLLQGQVLGSRCYLEGAGAGGGLYLFLEPTQAPHLSTPFLQPLTSPPAPAPTTATTSHHRTRCPHRKKTGICPITSTTATKSNCNAHSHGRQCCSYSY